MPDQKHILPPSPEEVLFWASEKVLVSSLEEEMNERESRKKKKKFLSPESGNATVPYFHKSDS